VNTEQKRCVLLVLDQCACKEETNSTDRDVDGETGVREREEPVRAEVKQCETESERLQENLGVLALITRLCCIVCSGRNTALDRINTLYRWRYSSS